MDPFNPNTLTGASSSVIPVGKGTRFVNALVDGIILAVVSSIISRMLVSVMGAGGATLGFPISLALQFCYYYFQEVGSYQTLGKRLTGTRVVMADGSAPTPEAIRTRNLWRLIPLIDALSFLFSDIGWHDKYSDTRVVSAK